MPADKVFFTSIERMSVEVFAQIAAAFIMRK